MTRRAEAVRLLGAALVCTALLGAARAQGDSAVDWLVRMNDAAQSVSYQGTFVYLHGNQVEAMSVARRVDNGSTRERLLALNGEPREIIRDEREVWCYLPDQRIGVHELRQVTDKGFPDLLPEELRDLESLYRVRFGEGGIERIANRDARHIVVDPVDRLRYGYQLWADTETGLLLRAMLEGPDGEPVEQYMFTRIELDTAVPAAALEPRTSRDSLEWYGFDAEESEPLSGELAWEVSQPPRGFRLVRHLRRREPMSGEPVEHLVLSDGLAAVSVFVTRQGATTKQPLQGVSRMGAVHAFGRVVDDHQVTVVGEVPAGTVRQVGLAVRRR